MSAQGENQSSDFNTEQESTQETNRQEAGKELIDELTRLGQRFVEVVEVAWNSEQRKKLEEDLKSGLVTVANSLEDGIKRVSSSKEAKEAVSAAEDVAEKVRTSKVGVELSQALAQGLRTLSEQLEKLSEDMKKKSADSGGETGSSSASETQDIPIDRGDA